MSPWQCMASGKVLQDLQLPFQLTAWHVQTLFLAFRSEWERKEKHKRHQHGWSWNHRCLNEMQGTSTAKPVILTSKEKSGNEDVPMISASAHNPSFIPLIIAYERLWPWLSPFTISLGGDVCGNVNKIQSPRWKLQFELVAGFLGAMADWSWRKLHITDEVGPSVNESMSPTWRRKENQAKTWNTRFVSSYFPFQYSKSRASHSLTY